jgi:hypothetical protein
MLILSLKKNKMKKNKNLYYWLGGLGVALVVIVLVSLGVSGSLFSGALVLKPSSEQPSIMSVPVVTNLSSVLFSNDKQALFLSFNPQKGTKITSAQLKMGGASRQISIMVDKTVYENPPSPVNDFQWRYSSNMDIPQLNVAIPVQNIFDATTAVGSSGQTIDGISINRIVMPNGFMINVCNDVGCKEYNFQHGIDIFTR